MVPVVTHTQGQIFQIRQKIGFGLNIKQKRGVSWAGEQFGAKIKQGIGV